jgi:NitT/TauT family transport system permease protein
MNIAPSRTARLLLALLPFVLIAMIYVFASAERRAVNPDDKLLPPVGEMADAIRRVAFQPDRRTGEIVLWTDTAASLQRLVLGLGIASLPWSQSSPWSRRWRSCRSCSSFSD